MFTSFPATRSHNRRRMVHAEGFHRAVLANGAQFSPESAHMTAMLHNLRIDISVNLAVGANTVNQVAPQAPRIVTLGHVIHVLQMAAHHGGSFHQDNMVTTIGNG